MFQCHVSHVSFQGYTYLTCDNECNMMLMRMIRNANACLTPRVLQHQVVPSEAQRDTNGSEVGQARPSRLCQVHYWDSLS
jgi:hypothetical protein